MYVALLFGFDGCLGRTILCQSWEEAIRACVILAKEHGEELTDEDLESGGQYIFDNGTGVFIGGLETL